MATRARLAGAIVPEYINKEQSRASKYAAQVDGVYLHAARRPSACQHAAVTWSGTAWQSALPGKAAGTQTEVANPSQPRSHHTYPLP